MNYLIIFIVELLRLGHYKVLAINVILNIVLTLIFVMAGDTLYKKVFI